MTQLPWASRSPPLFQREELRHRVRKNRETEEFSTQRTVCPRRLGKGPLRAAWPTPGICMSLRDSKCLSTGTWSVLPGPSVAPTTRRRPPGHTPSDHGARRLGKQMPPAGPAGGRGLRALAPPLPRPPRVAGPRPAGGPLHGAGGTRTPLTWILPGTPVLSIRLATLTVFPQMSYCGRRAPITPATTGPMLMPGREPPRSASGTLPAEGHLALPPRDGAPQGHPPPREREAARRCHTQPRGHPC